MYQILPFLKIYSKSVTTFVLMIAFLQFSAPILGAVLYRFPSKNHSVKKVNHQTRIKYKKKIKKRMNQTQNLDVVIFVFLIILLPLLGLILGAIFAIPGLWITCLAILSLIVVLAIIFLLLMMTAHIEC